MNWLSGRLPEIYKTDLIFFVVLFVFFLLAGCSSFDPADKRTGILAQDSGPVQVGAIADFKGQASPMLRGMKLALEQGAGNFSQVSNQKLELIEEDIQDMAKDALGASQRLTDNPLACAAISQFTPEVGMPSAVLLQYYGLLHFTTVSSHTQVTRQSFDKLFKIVPDDIKTVEFLPYFCAKKGFKNIIILQSDDEYGRRLANRFENAADSTGITVLERMTYNIVNIPTELKRKLTLWKKHYQIDGLFVSGLAQKARPIIRLVAELDLNIPLLGTSALDKPEILNALGKQQLYVRTYFNPDSANSKVKNFVQNYKQKFNTVPPAVAGVGYDSICLFKWAAARAGSVEPDKMAAVLRGDEFYTGVAGDFIFDQYGNFTPKEVYVKYVNAGREEYMTLLQKTW